MPKSKKRKRKGGVVAKYNRDRRNQRIDENSYGDGISAGVSLQDLINVVAYQEYVNDGTIIADDAKITLADDVPVTVGEGEDKRRVGTASAIPGDPEHVSINFDDPDTAAIIKAVHDRDAYSIDKENEDGR